MMLQKFLTVALAGSALVLVVPTMAYAQQYPTPEGEATQQQLDHLHDHLEHERQHQQIEDAHAREHASGFTSEEQHQAYHQQLDALHGQVHDQLPDTEHSHYNNGPQGYNGDQRYQSDGYGRQRVYRSYGYHRRNHRHHYQNYYR